jgi:hypothetical protein
VLNEGTEGSQQSFWTGSKSRKSPGEQWTKKLIEFLWTNSNTLWKDRCAAAHAPGEASPDNPSARTREAAQLRVELAYAHDWRVLDVPLEERLQSRTSELLAWVKTMLPVITQSVRDAQAPIRTGHRDIRGFFSRATAVPTDHTATIPIDTSSARPIAPALDIRQHLQNARTQIATISSVIRQYFPGIVDR